MFNSLFRRLFKHKHRNDLAVTMPGHYISDGYWRPESQTEGVLAKLAVGSAGYIPGDYIVVDLEHNVYLDKNALIWPTPFGFAQYKVSHLGDGAYTLDVRPAEATSLARKQWVPTKIHRWQRKDMLPVKTLIGERDVNG